MHVYILATHTILSIFRVSDAYKLAEWVSYLRDAIHKRLPGSVIIFYDSIVRTGELRW